MKDCWVSPYGEIIYIADEGIWLHAKKAQEILKERYNYDKPNKGQLDYLDVLHSKGWIRYSKYFNTGWIYNPYTITRDQKNVIFDLTGDIID